MPRLDESREALLHAGHDVGDRVSRAWDGFCDFVLRDNVLEVAVGLIVAAAFTKVANSFVDDIILPILSLLPFLQRNLDEKFAVLRKGPNYSNEIGYNTLKQARADGALVLAYGLFVDNVVNLFGVGLALYILAQLYVYFSHDPIIKRTVKCKYCRKYISQRAQRCVNCTSWQDGREDQPGSRSATD